MRAPPSWSHLTPSNPNYLPKAPSTNMTTVGNLGLQCKIWRGHKIQSTAESNTTSLLNIPKLIECTKRETPLFPVLSLKLLPGWNNGKPSPPPSSSPSSSCVLHDKTFGYSSSINPHIIPMRKTLSSSGWINWGSEQWGESQNTPLITIGETETQVCGFQSPALSPTTYIFLCIF